VPRNILVIILLFLYLFLAIYIHADDFTDAVNEGKSLGNNLYSQGTNVLKNSDETNFFETSLDDFCTNQAGGDIDKYNECMDGNPTGSLPYYSGGGANNEENLYSNPEDIDSTTSDSINNITNTSDTSYDNATEYVDKGLPAYDSYYTIIDTTNQNLIHEKQSKVANEGKFPEYDIGNFSNTEDIYYDDTNTFFSEMADNCTQVTETTTITNTTHVPDIKTCDKAMFEVFECNVKKDVTAECSANVKASEKIFNRLDGFVLVSNCSPMSGVLDVTFGCTKCHDEGDLNGIIPESLIAASMTYQVDIYSGTGDTYTTRLGPTRLAGGMVQGCTACINWESGCEGENFCADAIQYQAECDTLTQMFNDGDAIAGNCINNNNLAACNEKGYSYNPCAKASTANQSCIQCTDLQSECSATGCQRYDGIWYPPADKATEGHVNAVDFTCTTNCRDFNPTEATEECVENCSAVYYEVSDDGYVSDRFYKYDYCEPCMNYEKEGCPTTNTDPIYGVTVSQCNSWASSCAAEGCVEMYFEGERQVAKPLLTTTFDVIPFRLEEDLNNQCITYENDSNCSEKKDLRRCLDYSNPREIYIPATGMSYYFSEENFFVQRDLTDNYSYSDNETTIELGRLCYDVERTFYCGSDTYATNTCEEYENDPNCVQIGSKPLSIDNVTGDVLTLEVTYDCGQEMETYDSTQTEKIYDCNGAIRCMGLECKDVTYESNSAAAQASAAFQAMEFAAKNTEMDCDSSGNNCNIRVFKGESYKCKIALGGWQDCCEDINVVSFVDYIKVTYLSLNAAKQTGLTAKAGQLFSSAISQAKGLLFTGAEQAAMKTGMSASKAAATKRAGLVASKKAANSIMNKALVKTYDWMADKGMNTLAEGLMDKTITAGGKELITKGPWVQYASTAFSVVMWAYTAYQIADLLVQIIYACDESEMELAAQKPLKVCHYIGSYCSQDTSFGCIEKKKSYCCYDTPLARIVNEQGLPQVGKDFGSAKDPECLGFTMDEFGQLDWSSINLDEWMAYVRQSFGDDLFGKNVSEVENDITKIQNDTMTKFEIEYCDNETINCPTLPEADLLDESAQPESYMIKQH